MECSFLPSSSSAFLFALLNLGSGVIGMIIDSVHGVVLVAFSDTISALTHCSLDKPEQLATITTNTRTITMANVK